MPERVSGGAVGSQTPRSRAAARHGPVRDAAARQVLDRLTRLVTTLFDVPIAMINLVDEERLLFASWANRDGRDDRRARHAAAALDLPARRAVAAAARDRGRPRAPGRPRPARDERSRRGRVPRRAAAELLGEGEGDALRDRLQAARVGGAGDRDARGSRRDGDRLPRADARTPGRRGGGPQHRGGRPPHRHRRRHAPQVGAPLRRPAARTGRPAASAATTSGTSLASSGCATASPTDSGSARPPRCSPTAQRRRRPRRPACGTRSSRPSATRTRGS